MIKPVRLYDKDGLTLMRHQDGFVISMWSGAGITSKHLPFAEGDKFAQCFRPGFDPERDDPEALAIASIPPHPDD